MITSSESLQAKISPSNSTLIKRYVSTSKSPSPGVRYVFLAVKHLRTGAKQEPYMPLSECETLIQFQKERCKSNDAPADICAVALHCQQQKWDAFQHIHLLLLKVKHFISKIHKLASLGKYFKSVQFSLFWECFPVSTFINLFLSSIS